MAEDRVARLAALLRRIRADIDGIRRQDPLLATWAALVLTARIQDIDLALTETAPVCQCVTPIAGAHEPDCEARGVQYAPPTEPHNERTESYRGILPSGATVSGTKQAILEMQAAIWRAEPTTDCTGQTYRDFAGRCDLARQQADEKLHELLDAVQAYLVATSQGSWYAASLPVRERLVFAVDDFRRVRGAGSLGGAPEP